MLRTRRPAAGLVAACAVLATVVIGREWSSWNPSFPTNVGSTPGLLEARSPGKVAYSGERHLVYVMEPDGTGVTRIAEGSDPSFAPDGSRVAVGGMPLQLVDPDGTDAVTLTDDSTQLPPISFYSTTLPAFSPDGTQLLVTRFTEDAPNGLRSEIWVMNSDGSNPRRLTDPGISARAASWGARTDS